MDTTVLYNMAVLYADAVDLHIAIYNLLYIYIKYYIIV